MKRALAILLLFAACESPPHERANQCIPDWPAARSLALAPPLTGVTPAVLWRTPLSGGITNDWLVADDAHVAFTAGSRLYVTDRDGTLVASRGALSLERVSSPVLLDDGSFAFAGASAYLVDSAGQWKRWTLLPKQNGAYVQAGKLVALSPDGALMFGGSDGAAWAVDAQTGALRWRTPLAGAGQRAPAVLGGIGGAVFVNAPDTDDAADVLDARTGVALQHFAGEAVAMAGPTLGVVTQRMQDAGKRGHYPWMHLTVRDQCGKERWKLPATRPQWPTLIGADDALYVVERDDVAQSDTTVSVYAPDGTRTAGPTPAAIPWALGADGTLYGVRCDTPGFDGPSHLYAYDAQLHEVWHLDLGPGCPSAGPLIDASGRMYFTWYGSDSDATELVAVQTTSPGLLPSARPVRRGDARGTSWVK